MCVCVCAAGGGGAGSTHPASLIKQRHTTSRHSHLDVPWHVAHVCALKLSRWRAPHQVTARDETERADQTELRQLIRPETLSVRVRTQDWMAERDGWWERTRRQRPRRSALRST